MFNNIYKKKKVLITGNTGFKGSWLSLWLNELGAEVYGISKDIPTKPSHFELTDLQKNIQHIFCDVRDYNNLHKHISSIKPDFVFHLAAQPLVRDSYRDPRTTIETNTIGTMNILDALKNVNHKCAAVMITSDKCYDNVEWIWGYRENDALGGEDPYSASKGAAELVVKTYAKSYFSLPDSNVHVVSVRAGNVIGGGDWAKDRIVPDAVRAWSEDKPLVIRNPKATRPWQHVLEPLSGYLLAGEKLYEQNNLNAEPFNFGPAADQNYSVEELLAEMKEYWASALWECENPDAVMKESGLLKLNCDKALHLLGWKPTLDFQETVELLTNWYKTFYTDKQANINALTIQDIQTYCSKAEKKGLAWVK